MTQGSLFVDHELEAMCGSAIRTGDAAHGLDLGIQLQPASLDLRLSGRAYRMRAGFLPDARPIEERIESLSVAELSLDGAGAVLEKGLVYLVLLEEVLDLPPGVRGRFNPRSSTGRCDVFTRVLSAGHPRFDETPAGYAGHLWLEVSPLSFPVRLARGDRLCQLRLQQGRAGLSTGELIELYERTPLAFAGGRALGLDEVRFDDDGGLLLTVGLEGRDPAGWRASDHTRVLQFGAPQAHETHEFWEPVHAPHGRAILSPGDFYIFASRERLRVPPEYAAEMLPVDVGIGELRNNYAGFFDSGFGWTEGVEDGTPAVLEVRAHDVPFLIEDGQVFFRLRYFRTSGRPRALYGEGRRDGSYRDQDLTLARCFR